MTTYLGFDERVQAGVDEIRSRWSPDEARRQDIYYVPGDFPSIESIVSYVNTLNAPPAPVVAVEAFPTCDNHTLTSEIRLPRKRRGRQRTERPKPVAPPRPSGEEILAGITRMAQSLVQRSPAQM